MNLMSAKATYRFVLDARGVEYLPDHFGSSASHLTTELKVLGDWIRIVRNQALLDEAEHIHSVVEAGGADASGYPSAEAR